MSYAPSTRFFLNPVPTLRSEAQPVADPRALHRLLPGYAPTPLAEAPRLAARLELGRLWIKDESQRMGLPAFKILGAAWATARAIERLRGEPLPITSLQALIDYVAPLRPLTLAAATDGNHGRAVAYVARLLGLQARIFVPVGTAQPRIDAIAGEGAQVTVVAGGYDQAVAESAALASPGCLVISDTSWPGYEQTPRDVIDGYATIFHEIDEQLAERAAAQPDVVLVQIGVGALAAALVRHYRAKPAPPRIVGVEPTRAACLLASLQAGRIVTIPEPQDSIMAGLNCGTPSLVAWPIVRAGLDLLLAIDDERAREAMRALATDGIVAGETGAAGAGGLLELCQNTGLAELRAAAGLVPGASVLLISTEGATDPAAYREIVGAAI